MELNVLGNEEIMKLYRETLLQLSKLAEPLGKTILQYSRLRNEFSLISKEIEKRTKENKLNLEDYKDETTEIYTALHKLFQQSEKLFQGSRDAGSESGFNSNNN